MPCSRDAPIPISRGEPGATLDFLGYSFRLDKDLHGRKQSYWNMHPSKKALARERDKLREIIHWRRCWQPMPELIQEVNQHLKGWAGYFAPGYSRKAFRQINRYVREKLSRHLDRRSQRSWRAPQGVTACAHLNGMGLISL